MPTPTVNLGRISVLAEVVLRSGNTAHPNALQVLQVAYAQPDPAFPGAIGMSVLFREGATLDELAREGAFPHASISYAAVGRIMTELVGIGLDLVLFITPAPLLPDHHSLAVAQGGVIQTSLSDAAAQALMRAFSVVSNPYRKP